MRNPTNNRWLDAPPRRLFLRRSALVMASGAVGLAGCAGAAPEQRRGTPPAPWPYEPLDVELVRKRGHEGYYNGECCYGAFSAILFSLREMIGYPFTELPPEMMAFGGGGVAGWGTLCGALLGSSAAINLVTEKEDAKAIISELLGWYSEARFPTETSNEYAVKHQFLVAEYKSDKALPQSISHSPLCHVSVSNWCTEAGIASGAKERSERCGRLTGDVAAWAVKLLNDQQAGTFQAVYQPSPATSGCMECHKKGEEFETGHFTSGLMECTQCHEPHGQ